MANNTLPVIARLLTSSCGSKIDADTPTGCQVSFWLLRTIPFILLIVGTIGNVLNLIVLSRPRMRKQPTTVYLLFLACSDLTMLWNTLLRSTLLRGWAVDIRNMSPFVCATQEFLIFCCAIYSVWLLVAISLERMLLTKFPVAARSKITRRNAVIVCIVLLIFSALFTVHLSFGKTYQNVQQKSQSGDTEIKFVSRCTYVSAAYLYFFQNEWSLLLLLFLSAIPTILLFCCNAVIIWTLFVQGRRVRPSDNAPNAHIAVRNERGRALTRMIVFIAVFFLLTMSPYNIYIFIISGLPDDTTEEQLSNLVMGFLIVMYTGVSNYALNFFFYFGSGPMFKRELNKFWSSVLSQVRRMLGMKTASPEAEGTTSKETSMTIATVI